MTPADADTLGDHPMPISCNLGNLTVHFTRGSHRFEVCPSRSDQGVTYVGFYDGLPSVVARESHVATRMLLRRHASSSSAFRVTR
jgi:hypothetical protein